MKNPPLKRHKALQNLSREHHDTLLFVLRLQKGVAKKAQIGDMQDYVNWFWETHLRLHFELEEKELFPRFGLDQKLVIKALSDHQKIKSLIENELDSYDAITTLSKTLKAHIRFEERELFRQIQQSLSKEALSKFEAKHKKQLDCGLWLNRFWE